MQLSIRLIFTMSAERFDLRNVEFVLTASRSHLMTIVRKSRLQGITSRLSYLVPDGDESRAAPVTFNTS